MRAPCCAWAAPWCAQLPGEFRVERNLRASGVDEKSDLVAPAIARFARSLWNLGTRNRLINGPSSNPREYHSQVVPPALLSLVQAPRHVGLGADHGAAGSGRRTPHQSASPI
jgi:hypothetical protein